MYSIGGSSWFENDSAVVILTSNLYSPPVPKSLLSAYMISSFSPSREPKRPERSAFSRVTSSESLGRRAKTKIPSGARNVPLNRKVSPLYPVISKVTSRTVTPVSTSAREKVISFSGLPGSYLDELISSATSLSPSRTGSRTSKPTPCP